MSETFKHHAFDNEQIQLSELIRDSAEELEANIALYCVPGREKSLATTKLEECVMWANKSIALHGVWEPDFDAGC